MLVPSITRSFPPWRISSAPMVGTASADSAAAIKEPGAAMSGLVRPSRVGPRLLSEKWTDHKATCRPVYD